MLQAAAPLNITERGRLAIDTSGRDLLRALGEDVPILFEKELDSVVLCGVEGILLDNVKISSMLIPYSSSLPYVHSYINSIRKIFRADKHVKNLKECHFDSYPETIGLAIVALLENGEKQVLLFK